MFLYICDLHGKLQGNKVLLSIKGLTHTLSVRFHKIFYSKGLPRSIILTKEKIKALRKRKSVIACSRWERAGRASRMMRSRSRINIVASCQFLVIAIVLWLVETDHVTWIPASDWSRQITWPEYWPLIGRGWQPVWHTTRVINLTVSQWM